MKERMQERRQTTEESVYNGGVLSIKGEVTMNIYVFTSNAGSYNDGEYYFAAERMGEAAKMAQAFQKDHNKKHAKGTPAYKIDFEEDVRIFVVRPGYLPLNRQYKERS